MNNDELTKDQADAVLMALNNAIEQGPWDGSNFLRIMGEKLQKVRDDFVNEMTSLKSDHETTMLSGNRNKSRGDQKKVYVALYSSNGKSMQSWEWMVTNLPRQIISRPIYLDEQHVKAIIKTKENPTNEAYVVIYINEDDILPVQTDKVSLDKLGNPRLLLKDGAFKLNNLDCFVHQTGIYHFSQGRLIKDAMA